MKRVVKCYGCGRLVRMSCAYIVHYTGGSYKDKRVKICPVCFSGAGYRVTSKVKRKAFNLDPLRVMTPRLFGDEMGKVLDEPDVDAWMSQFLDEG